MLKTLIRSSSKRDDGFTLIELLVVVIIIGILSSIAVVGISGARKSAYAGQCTANASQLLKAIVAYKASNDFYPGETGSTAFPSSPAVRPFVISELFPTGTTTVPKMVPDFLSSPLPYNGDTSSITVGRTYYLYATLTIATGAINVTGYKEGSTPVAGNEFPGCKASSIG